MNARLPNVRRDDCLTLRLSAILARTPLWGWVGLAGLMLCGCLTVSSLQAGNPVPAELPDPDGSTGTAEKPVQVYILAGQSNMVGMGHCSGARPPYKGLFLSADPAVPGEIMGRKVKPLLITASDDANAEEGAVASIYRGAYDPAKDYDATEPVKKATVAFGVAANSLPAIDGPHTVVVRAFIEVPQDGTYTVMPGLGESTRNIAVVDGTEVYRKEADEGAKKQAFDFEEGRRYPLTITYLESGSTALFLSKQDLVGFGDLKIVTQREGKFPWLVDENGKWTVRQDVTFREARLSEKGRHEPLTVTSNGGKIGPELGFGYIVGTYHDAQVLLVKTAQGNRSLSFDFRPPSSGRENPDSKWEGLEYRLMVEGVRKSLDNLADIVPNYQGQGYEMAGFVWWQGHKDQGKPTAEYEKHLVNLINDVRKEFDAPNMPAAIATVGFGGYDMAGKYMKTWQAQMNVAAPEKHPELAKTVATVDTRPFWRDRDESPSGRGYHYNNNAETYMLVGDSLGRAMVDLQGGHAEPLPLAEQSKAEAKVRMAKRGDADAEKPKLAPTTVQTALRPLIMNEFVPAYIEKNRETLLREANWKASKRPGKFAIGRIDGSSWKDGVADFYRQVGIHDYDWDVFGPARDAIEWQYATFAPKEEHKGGRWHYRKVALPDGMENWFAKDFDADTAAWKTGRAPFAIKNGKRQAVGNCDLPFCNCGQKPNTLWAKEVLLMRATVEVPQLDKDCRYRVVIGGRSHVNAGDGVAIYIDGKKAYEQSSGVGKRQGALPVGFFIDEELAKEFEDGEVTIAAKAFRGNKGYIAVWMQKMTMPPLPSVGK